jgi:hypothetical protein
MNFVYVVIEPEVNPVVFATFADAKASVLEKYREELELQEEEAEGWPIASEVHVPESTTGVTYLYIEKGINIYIYRLPIIPPSQSMG